MWYLDADLRICWRTNSNSNVGADVVLERRLKDALVHNINGNVRADVVSERRFTDSLARANKYCSGNVRADVVPERRFKDFLVHK